MAAPQDLFIERLTPRFCRISSSRWQAAVCEWISDVKQFPPQDVRGRAWPFSSQFLFHEGGRDEVKYESSDILSCSARTAAPLARLQAERLRTLSALSLRVLRSICCKRCTNDENRLPRAGGSCRSVGNGVQRFFLSRKEILQALRLYQSFMLHVILLQKKIVYVAQVQGISTKLTRSRLDALLLE